MTAEQARKRRYEQNTRTPEQRREANRRYYLRHRERECERRREYSRRRPDMNRKHARLARERRERVPYTPEAVGYIEILRGDPCSYCGASSTEPDHIDAVRMGGTGDADNLTAACKACNSSKKTRSLLEHLLARS